MLSRTLLFACRCLAVLAVLAGSTGSARSRTPAAEPDAPALDELLDRLGRVASLYRDTALEFACDEAISWRTLDGGIDRQRFGYVFTWDETAGFDDYRTRQGRPSLRLKQAWPRSPAFVRSALLWVFVFRPERRGLHDYELLGPDEVHSRPAWRIRFTPRLPHDRSTNWWYGTAWIDRESSQLLRIETWDIDDQRERERIELALAGGEVDTRPFRTQTIIAEFTILEHGMRFPEEITIRRDRVRVVGPARRRRIKRRNEFVVTQTYTGYEFFSVRTEEEIRERVDGAGYDPR